MLSETIAELERLYNTANDSDFSKEVQVMAGQKLADLFWFNAPALLAAAKLSEKMPKYADTGEAFVPEVDPSWICQLSGHPCKMSPGWHAPDRKWMVAGREQFYSTPEAAANAWQAKTASENNTREKQK